MRDCLYLVLTYAPVIPTQVDSRDTLPFTPVSVLCLQLTACSDFITALHAAIKSVLSTLMLASVGTDGDIAVSRNNGRSLITSSNFWKNGQVRDCCHQNSHHVLH